MGTEGFYMDMGGIKTAVKEFCKNPSWNREQALIAKIDQACPKLFENLRVSLDAFFKDPHEEVTRYLLKQAILAADAEFSAAYKARDEDGEHELGVDDLEQVYHVIFNQALNTNNELKISHIKQLAEWTKEEAAKASQQQTNSQLTEANKGVAKHQMAEQVIIASGLGLLTNSIRRAYPLSHNAITVRRDLLNSIERLVRTSGLDKNRKSLLRKLKDEIREFFSDRLFYDATATDLLISHIKQVNEALNLTIDDVDIRHVREEFCLLQIITIIAVHAKNYQDKYFEDAQIAKQLAKDLAQLTDGFFVAADFSEKTQQKFLQQLSNRIQQDQEVLAKHHDGGELVENIALVTSSFVGIGIVPALFKFYKRTIEGDSTFSYFSSKSEHLVKDALKLAKQITTSDSSSIKPSR